MLGKSLLFLVLLLRTCTVSAQDNYPCDPSFCGNNTIRHPFRLKTDPLSCGYPGYELSCENNRTVLYLGEDKYLVRSIDYDDFTIRIVDVGLQEGNCSSMPYSSFHCNDYPGFREYSCSRSYYKRSYGDVEVKEELARTIAYMECANEIDSPFYTKTYPCFKSQNSSSTFSRINGHPYIVDAHNASCLEGSCTTRWVTGTSWPGSRSHDPLSYEVIHKKLVHGFQLSWLHFLHKGCNCPYCYVIRDITNTDKSFTCYDYTPYYQGDYPYFEDPWYIKYDISVPGEILKMFFIITRSVGAPCVAIFLLYKWRRRNRALDESIEEFLQNQKKLFPIRYSYYNIRIMTRNFKDKLGEGGYGSVYKGKLRSGQDVAIKILKYTKTSGQDFINEVATIGRIHHANVVKLIGFCVAGSKCALVYDFMPNGSLDKHIFYRENDTSLGWKDIYEISLGVARGIEYLHGGCGMQILHFDIKPHNILLDKNFIPKISDFGLAKLYPTSHTIVSLTAARGTFGYMAPELVYKTVGRVSHKADVYSFGKLLMEMAARRKNVDVTMEHSSKIYFPSWVYDQLTKAHNIETIDFVEEEGREITIKMMIVALWCIQMNPNDRPTMHEVLKMLEGPEYPPMPRKPFLYPPEVFDRISNTNANIELTESSTFVSSSLSPNNFPSGGGDIEEIPLM